MTIKANIEQVMKDIEKDPDLSERLRAAAVGAIYTGEGSDDWTKYMGYFATNKTELARLTGKDDTPCDPVYPYHKPARAYLIANGTCGTPTVKNFLNGVTEHLDHTLPLSEHKS